MKPINLNLANKSREELEAIIADLTQLKTYSKKVFLVASNLLILGCKDNVDINLTIDMHEHLENWILLNNRFDQAHGGLPHGVN